MVINCKKPCKKKRSTMLTVEQMVDIALGTPEIGAVNFNVLHALIHVIIQQLNIQKCLVEFKGYDSDRMEGIILSAKPGPILKLSEYMIDVGDGKPCGKERSSKTTKKEDEEREGKEGRETFGKRPPCECTGKKRRSNEDEKEKADKGKDESDADEKKKETKKEIPSEECEDVEEPEPKKIREVKKPKPCPCKVAGEKDKEQGICADESLKAVPSSYYGSDSEGTCQTIVRVEPVGERCDNWRSRPALAHESMIKLEEKVAMLQDAFEALEQMPTNEELKKRAQGGPCVSTPVKDLWQIYNLNKRVESCEGTIEKLASMIEDLVKESCNYREAMLVIAGAVDEIECADQTARTCCAALQGKINSPFIDKTGGGSKIGESQTVTFTEEKKDAEAQAKVSSKPATPPPQKEATPPPTPLQPTETETDKPPDQMVLEGTDAAPASLVEEESEEQGAPPPAEPFDSGLPISLEELQGIGPEYYKMSAGERFCLLKEYIDCIICQLKNQNQANQFASKLCALVSLQKQLDNLEKEWRQFLESLGPEGVGGVTSAIGNFKAEIDRLHNTIAKIVIEKNEFNSMLREVSDEARNLKRMKADLELVEDLLAEKADACLLNRKVSHDQFDAACDDLTRGLDEALERLMQQEVIWNEALEELQKGLDSKLDKIEIMPLKEFINKKLRCLQEKLKQLAQLRKDAEAAGAKSRILRNVNCIACDADVVMKMDNKSAFQHPSLTASKSIKPMLTYELDQVRKAMKKGPPCRGPPQQEETFEDKKKGLPLTSRDAIDSKMSKFAHFCSRYCGGSHTITTPQQRVTRIGHFLTEFGPQAMTMFNQECFESKPASIHQENVCSGFSTPNQQEGTKQ